MNSPTVATKAIKVIAIDDIGINVVELPAGTYQIDGEVVSHDGWNSYNKPRQISVKGVDDIRQITSENLVSHYVNAEEEILDVAQYNREKANLLKEATLDKYEEDYEWSSLEAEFAYRKFMQEWKQVTKTITHVSEPLLVDKTHIKQDTGIPHIKAVFITGQAHTPLYSYDRAGAVHSLMAKKFESLGMEFKQVSSYSQTEGKKIWSNSDHSGLEYVTAFGKYIIGKNLVARTRGELKGSFEVLEKAYKEDKEWIETYIQTLYNLHFRNEGASSVLLSDVRNGVQTAINYVNTLDVKVKSETSKRAAIAKLNELLKLVDKEVLEK